MILSRLPTSLLHVSTAEAITPATVWCYPRERLEGLIHEMPSLSYRLLTLANGELLNAHNHILCLDRKVTLERVALFLLQLSERVADGGSNPRQLYLPVTRSDIADYLGTTTETVSRTFSWLRKVGAISFSDGSRMVECDLDMLRRFTTAEDDPTLH